MMSYPTHSQRRPRGLVRWIVCLLLVLPLPWGNLLKASSLPSITTAEGSRFKISGESSLSGIFTLTIYDGDSTYHTYTDKGDKGMFLFTGGVAKPVLASLQHNTMSRPLYFFLENSEIRISLNATRPELSVISNSRSNSEYRYLMERYRNAADRNSFLKQYAKEAPASIYLPFVLYQEMGSLDDGVVRQIISMIADEGRHTYHYTLLRRWMKATPAVSEGSEMPDFAYLNSKKERCTFEQTRNTEGATLIVFGANWCDRCKAQKAQAEKTIGDRPIKLLTINIDDNPNGWDANYLKQLSVDHIPYMILVDKRGIVVARDIRIWELERVLKKGK